MPSRLEELTKKEQILRFEVEKLREELLLREHQILYRIARFFWVIIFDLTGFLRKPKVYTDVSLMKDTEVLMYEKKEAIIFLEKEKQTLIRLKKSPLIILVFVIRGFSYLALYIPERYNRFRIRKELGADSKKKTLLVLGHRPVFSQKGRPGQLCMAMHTRGYRVIYIENSIITESQASGRLYKATKISQDLFAVQLKGQKALETTYGNLGKKEVSVLQAALSQLFSDLGLDHKNTFLKIDHPFWGYILNTKIGKFIYEVSFTKELPPHLIQKEKQLIKQSKAIIAATRKQLKRKRVVRLKKTVVIPNGSDYMYFEKASVKSDTCSVGLCWIHRPVVGCIGATDERIDARLLDFTARAFPKASIVLEGVIHSPAILAVAEKHSNIFFIGEKPYEKLSSYLQTFDICVMPYWKQVGEDDPEEVYDYMAAEKAVVTPITPFKRNIKPPVYDSYGEADFILQMHRALKEKIKGIKKKRQLFAKKNTWERRAKQMERIFYKITNNK